MSAYPTIDLTKKFGVVGTIENCVIQYYEDDRFHYVAKAAIDGDGTGASHGDPDFQPRTSLREGGNSLNSDTEPYIVVPPMLHKFLALHAQASKTTSASILGAQARVFNRLNKLSCWAVVGDVGPGAKIGEISIACARLLGIAASPTRGGEDSHVIEYDIWPGVPAQITTLGSKTCTLLTLQP